MSNDSKKKIAASPERYTFQRDSYMKRRAEEGKTPENDKDVAAMADYFDTIIEERNKEEVNEEWKKNNLEYDLRSTEWICDKVKQNEIYAQNLYAAMCNNDFQKLDVVPILKEEHWHCSWRYAGGIVADMRGEGDYIDWYCSGIRGDYDDEPTERNYVSESAVTDEIREDLKQLGWVVVPQNDEDFD